MRNTPCGKCSATTDKRVRFDDDSTIAALQVKPFALEVRMLDADLYSIRFGE